MVCKVSIGTALFAAANSGFGQAQKSSKRVLRNAVPRETHRVENIYCRSYAERLVMSGVFANLFRESHQRRSRSFRTPSRGCSRADYIRRLNLASSLYSSNVAAKHAITIFISATSINSVIYF